jgi:hypothetical protein
VLRKLAASLVIVSMGAVSVLAVGSKNVEYVGGTVPGLSEKTEGFFTTTSDTALAFRARNQEAEIPYKRITELEYGQNAGRRVGVAILISPLALFSKKRKHFLTITYKDKAGKEQAGVFELGKDVVRTTLKILEVRSGQEIKFQDAEACKQYKTPKECEAGK